MYIQYINKMPSKIEFFDMLRLSETQHIDITKLDNELFNTITAVCAYNDDKLIGMGRVKKEDNFLYIQDVIVELDELKEEIQKNIIVNLIKQVNEIKYTNIDVRDCLQMSETKTNFFERYDFLNSEKNIV